MEANHKIKLEMAPMEGITTYIYRNAFARHFGKIDKYYTPFISLHREKEFNHKERNEILPEHNAGIFVVPQVLTNSSEDFLRAARKLEALGYEEVNINLGCPSGTVTAKGKGAGMLSDPDRLDAFLDGIFAGTPVAVSVKTRLGMTDVSEWDGLLAVYRSYPLKELIIHARVRDDFYENSPNPDAFAKALPESPWPVCYNGDIFSAEDYERSVQTFAGLERVMLGRGLLADPYLPAKICTLTGEADSDSACKNTCSAEICFRDRRCIREFHDEVYRGYQETQMGERNVLFRMKELWTYMIHGFESSDKWAKKIRKAGSYAAYEEAVRELMI